jgi:DNA-binding SARP family transcriptional activator/Tfp pilus assembly protein PilF
MATVQVRLLGPVDVLVDGVSRPLGGLRRKAVIAVLALRAGRVVSSEWLAELIWGDSPPVTAVNSLQQHISSLRAILGMKSAILARSPGYVLNLGDEATDAQVAERLIRDGTSSVDPERRMNRLQAAVALWRGPPLAELAGLTWFAEQARQFDDSLLQTRQALIELRLALGQHAQVVSELESLFGAHPLHEQLAGLLMRALYGIGRQADALAAFHRLRHTLNEDLGIDPSPQLRDLETAILRQDPTLAVAPGTLPSAAAEAPLVISPRAPAQLPSAVAGFTGRGRELNSLDDILAEMTAEAAEANARRPAPVGIFAVSGTAGVGKTAVAVQWAHRIADRFPDGQLYVNLRGYDPEQPISAADALAGFLRALGVPGQDVPLDLDERAARYRTELSRRRVLLVLDNAGSVEQVRPLLPGTAGCMAVVTSRDSLAGLVALDGAHRLDLELLPMEDAVALLRRLIGARVDAEPAAAAELARQCARLPLALRVAAELASTHPASSLAGLAKELGDQQRRLELLDAAGEIRTAVRSVFSWSYQQLPQDAARAFRMLGLHPGPDFDAYAVAALTDITVEDATRLCALLARAHLIHPSGPGRYVVHDLLRAYASYLAGAEDSEPGRRAALSGLFDYYLAAAAAAMDTLHPAERHKRPRVEPARTPVPSLRRSDPARAWLDTERPNLVVVCAYTAAHGWVGHTVRLAQTLFRYLDIAGHHTEALTTHTHAHRAARASGDRPGEARALNNLAAVYWWQAQHRQAADYYQEAVALFRASRDRGGEADALTNLGVVHRSLGELARAIEHHQHALVLYRETGNVVGEAQALTSLGIVYTTLGQLAPAAEHYQLALVLWRETGKSDGEADALTNLGCVYLRQGELERAAECHELALTRYRQHGYRGGEANTLNNLGLVFCRQNDLARAADYHKQALALHRRSGTRIGEAAALNGLGETLRAAGSVEEARRHHLDALTLATEIGDRYEQAHACDGLAATYDVAGNSDEALAHWERALHIYTSLGTADADVVRASMRRLRPGPRVNAGWNGGSVAGDVL